jgi:hypothetical protein
MKTELLRTITTVKPSGFRGKAVLEIDQSETRIACGGHVC